MLALSPGCGRCSLRRPLLLASALVALGLQLVLACSGPSDGEGDSEQRALFAADYATRYTEVRDCRPSGDHDLNNIRILVDPGALIPYLDRRSPFPTGSIVLKEEYEFDDGDCSGDIKQWTVMQKLEEGSAPATLDWEWQQVDATRNVVDVDLRRCIGCHTPCNGDSVGYDATCADP